jgi:dephospho-CoA kinase
MFTYEEDVPLKQVLSNMKNVYGEEEGPSSNLTGAALREEFKKVLPDFDEDRVYDSDIKKLFSWYGLLKSRDMLDFEASEENTEEESEENA